MGLQFYKKTEATESGDDITTYYVMNEKQSTLLIMNRLAPIRYIITCLPAGIEVTGEMKPIAQDEFMRAATQSNNAVCWYVDEVNKILQ